MAARAAGSHDLDAPGSGSAGRIGGRDGAVRRRSVPAQLHNIPLPEPHLAALAAGLALHVIRPWRLGGSPLPRILGAGALTAAGAALAAWSVHAAGAVDLERPGGLVTGGPYAVVRNPMYDAWGLLSAGAGLAVGSWWPLALVPVATAAVHGDVLAEEQRLEARFGQQYREYRAHVPRYLPAWRRMAGRRP